MSDLITIERSTLVEARNRLVQCIDMITAQDAKLINFYDRLAKAIGLDGVDFDREVLLDYVEEQLWRIKELDES